MKTYEILFDADIYEIKAEVNRLAQNGYELEQITSAPDGLIVVMSKKTSPQTKNRGERLIEEALTQFEPQCLTRAEYWAKEFMSHRRKIKKSVKTERPILLFLKELDKLCENGYDVANAVETMKNREWQTLKYEYIAGKDAGDNGVAFM